MRLELRREREAAAIVVVIERLDAGPVAIELELSRARVPERDREHAVDLVDERFAPLEVRVQHDLGVGIRPERMAALRELLAQLEIAVDLAVEDEPALAVRREHRLIRGGAQIDDRKPAEADADRSGRAEARSRRVRDARSRRAPPRSSNSARFRRRSRTRVARPRASPRIADVGTLGRRTLRRKSPSAWRPASARQALCYAHAHDFSGRRASRSDRYPMTLKIAHVNVARGYRGGERQTELLIRALRGVDVEQVLVARRGAPLASRLADAAEVRPVSGSTFSVASATADVELVHVHEGRSVYGAYLRWLLSRTPYVITRRVNNPIRRALVRAIAHTGVPRAWRPSRRRWRMSCAATIPGSGSKSSTAAAAACPSTTTACARFARRTRTDSSSVTSARSTTTRKGRCYIIAVARELERDASRHTLHARRQAARTKAC